jgi:hypothetical protein
MRVEYTVQSTTKSNNCGVMMCIDSGSDGSDIVIIPYLDTSHQNSRPRQKCITILHNY